MKPSYCLVDDSNSTPNPNEGSPERNKFQHHFPKMEVLLFDINFRESANLGQLESHILSFFHSRQLRQVLGQMVNLSSQILGCLYRHIGMAYKTKCHITTFSFLICSMIANKFKKRPEMRGVRIFNHIKSFENTPEILEYMKNKY